MINIENVPVMGLGLLCSFLRDEAAKTNFVAVSDAFISKVFNKLASRAPDDINWDTLDVKSHNFKAKLSTLSRLPAYSYNIVNPDKISEYLISYILQITAY